MENCEALLIKKSTYGEADYIITFFTKELGKQQGFAKSAKKSKKRFGGRLEPFIHLKVDFKLIENRLNSINDVSVIKVYSGIMQSLESFAIGSFVLEYIDIVTSENAESEELFNETIKTFDMLNSNKNLLPTLLKFQLKALELCGYKPSLETTNDEKKVKFNISEGSVVSSTNKANNIGIFDFYLDIISNPDLMEIFLAKVASNIKVLTKYTEYHTGKQFKSSKFLEELNL